MNKKTLRLIGKIASLVGLALSSIVSLLYFVTNIRLLFSGDYIVYSSPTAGFFHALFNVIMYAFIIATMIISYIYFLNKKGKAIQICYWMMSIAYMIISIAHMSMNKLSFSSGYEGYLTVVIQMSMIIAVVGNILYYLGLENNQDAEQ